MSPTCTPMNASKNSCQTWQRSPLPLVVQFQHGQIFILYVSWDDHIFQIPLLDPGQFR